MKSLYVHFPFCESKCHYCDFYSLGREQTRPGDAPTFEAALRAESALQAKLLAPTLDTIFLGGGTPSMTPVESMARALEPLGLETRVTAATEWTMEANPSSITQGSMRDYRKFGVNRVSMGVQSTNDEFLHKLGRAHSRSGAIQALEAVFAAGFDNVSVDLLCGVPGQTPDDLRQAMEDLTRFPITHLSCYLLTLPKQHRLYRELPDEDGQLEHLLFVGAFLKERGFEHYEISNFAKHGKRARHNLNYWKGASYLGLGPSAHSFDALTQKRWKNFSSLERYSAALKKGQAPIEWTETLTARQQELEKWMLALRLEEGFPATWLDTESRRQKALGLTTRGLLEIHPLNPTQRRLTARGFALSDQIIAELA